MGLGRPMVFVALGAALAAGVVRVGPELLALRARPSASEAPPPNRAGGRAGGEEGSATARVAEHAASTLEAEPTDPSERTYYRYLDAAGSVHYVDSLKRVPDAFRASAKPMGMRGGSRQSEAPRLNRAETSAPPRRPYARVAAQPPARRAATGVVVVYSTSWCGWCRKTIAWLDERGVDYENRDIEENPAWRGELLEKSGGTSIPVVEIEGELIRGFDPERMSELL